MKEQKVVEIKSEWEPEDTGYVPVSYLCDL